MTTTVMDLRDELTEKYPDMEIDANFVANLELALKDLGVDGLMEVKHIAKTSEDYDALIIKKDEHDVLGVCINLVKMYDAYQGGMTLADIAEQIKVKINDDPIDVDDTLAKIANYNWVKPRLTLRVSNEKRFEKLQANGSVPHKNIENLVLTCHIDLGKMTDGTEASTIVNDALLRTYGISEKQLFNDAMDAQKETRQMVLQSLFDLLGCEARTDCVIPFVLTAENQTHGASELFIPDVFKTVAERFGACYCLPSSIHEWLILPKDDDKNPADYKKIVGDVNGRYVESDEWLSDDIYQIENGVFSKVTLDEENAR